MIKRAQRGGRKKSVSHATGTKLEAAYFEALGRFVHAFAKAESMTHFSFSVYAKLDSEVARAIKGGMRLKELMPLIRRLMELNGYGEEDKAEVKDLFEQFNRISILRDTLLHRGADVMTDGTLHSSNAATARAKDHEQVSIYEIEDLHAAIGDLQRISLRVLATASGQRDEFKGVCLTAPGAPGLFGPWLYTPRSQETLSPQLHPKTQSRKRP